MGAIQNFPTVYIKGHSVGKFGFEGILHKSLKGDGYRQNGNFDAVL
jgi:hypothetical protein